MTHEGSQQTTTGGILTLGEFTGFTDLGRT